MLNETCPIDGGGGCRCNGVTSVLKYITPTHFFVARIGANDVVQSGHGGPYTLADGKYTETLAQGFGAPLEEMEKYRGVSVAFQCRLNGDVLHIVGDVQQHKVNEQWRRVAGTSAQRSVFRNVACPSSARVCQSGAGGSGLSPVDATLAPNHPSRRD